MADGYLEKHQAEYEARRDAFLHGKKRQTARGRGTGGAVRGIQRTIQRPEDEAL